VWLYFAQSEKHPKKKLRKIGEKTRGKHGEKNWKKIGQKFNKSEEILVDAWSGGKKRGLSANLGFAFLPGRQRFEWKGDVPEAESISLTEVRDGYRL